MKKLTLLFAVLLIQLAALQVYAADGGIATERYEIKPAEINTVLYIDSFRVVQVSILNKQDTKITVETKAEGSIADVITLSTGLLSIPPSETGVVSVTLLSDEAGDYNGTLVLTGAISEKIPIQLSVRRTIIPDSEVITISAEPLEKKIKEGEDLMVVVDVQNLLIANALNVSLEYVLKEAGVNGSEIVLGNESYELNISISMLKIFSTKEIEAGDYIFEVRASYLSKTSFSGVRFSVVKPFLEIKVFGIIPLKYLLAFVVLGSLGYFGYRYYHKRQAKKKRYKSKLDFSQLPKEGPRSVVVGKIAETNKKAYFDIDQLQSHTLIAGSTGGGKTVSAEVLVEEALMKGAAAIVFDPTAQWTGFLRKNTSKKMFDLYPLFGMKPTDARAFNGNVKQIMNAREIIDVKRYIKPGELTSFAINRLEPEDIDILVANTIRQVFKANLPDSKELKLIIIFDEVHRLLPKFGGTGQGFIQVERAAREFRKWGVGLILISQVLTDFIGETKANIGNEIQMRTRDQGDLDRIKTKYGDYMLQSLLKSATGTGMYENASYNRGEPYFISFRPLIHQHAALSDEILADYNKYNAILDEIEYQIEQLKNEGLDVFDFSLELKMAFDKVKSGSFNMVDIYLESLKPRLAAEWTKLGKQPKKMEIKLVSEEELEKEHQAAVEAREKEESKGAGEKKKEEKPELKPLRLKSGIVVLSIQELQDALPTLSAEHFAFHLNQNKNDFADWLDPVEPELAKKVRAAKSKDELAKALNEAGQSKEKDKK
ncbi:DUF87 domain-containing protein [Candidatus Woesearchaeota archaeon]|nr:DUF87 domain-containing protein [Candidatus Woesearchaeota archaeon]